MLLRLIFLLLTLTISMPIRSQPTVLKAENSLDVKSKLAADGGFQASCRLSVAFMRRFLIQHYSPVDGPLLRQVVPDSSAPPGSAANFG